jgi:hypothetical protein
LPIARAGEGGLEVPKAAIRAAASRLPQSDIPSDVKDRAGAVLDSYKEKAGMETDNADEKRDDKPAEERQEEEAAQEKDKRGGGIPARQRKLRRARFRKRAYQIRGMFEVGHLAWLVESLFQATKSAEIETALERDDSKLPGMLAEVLRDLGSVLIAMTEEEVEELINNTEIGPEEALDEAGLDDDQQTLVLAAASPALRRFRLGLYRARNVALYVRAGKVLSAETERCLRQAMDDHEEAMRTHRAAMRLHARAADHVGELLDRVAKPEDEDEPDPGAEEAAGPENGENGNGEEKPKRVAKDEGARSAEFRRRQAELLKLRAA